MYRDGNYHFKIFLGGKKSRKATGVDKPATRVVSTVLIRHILKPYVDIPASY